MNETTQPAADDAPPEGDASNPMVPPLPSAEPTGDVIPVDLRDWVDFSIESAQRIRVFTTATLAQDLWCVEPQQATSVLRYADADVTYTVLGGRAWFVTEQGEAGLDPLASVLVPAGVTHGIDNRGADPLIVLAVAGPPSDDEQPGTPLTSLAKAIRPDDTTGSVGARFRKFLAGA